MNIIDTLIDSVIGGTNPSNALKMVEGTDQVMMFYKPKLSDFKVGKEIVQPDKSGDFTLKAKVKSIDGGMITTDKGGQYTPDELRLLK